MEKNIILFKSIESLKTYTFFDLVFLLLEIWTEKINKIMEKIYALKCSLIYDINIILNIAMFRNNLKVPY